ncbi:MAG: nucleoside hydrolase [Myxococcota bacterium]|nr:nucleoside hydrolase [Myxococcota bacterium]
MRPILLDTDIGSDVDDALALGLILASPEVFELVAVTTVAGDTAVRARIAARQLGLAGRTGIEVCAGAREPLLRGPGRFVWFGHEGDGLPAGPDAVLSDEPGPERIVRAARECDGLELVAIGPMTNVARALALDPELPKRVAGLTIMGGHVRRVVVGGREIRPGIDYNLCSDPEASVAVLGAGFRTMLVTADVTLRTWMSPGDVDRLAAAPGPVAQLLAGQLHIWAAAQKKLFRAWKVEEPPGFAAFLHDPLTILALIDPAPLRIEALRIVPTIQAGILRTLEVDPEDEPGAPMQVATEVDAPAAAAAIVRRLALV